MKGHIGSFLLGLGAAAAGAFVYDKVRSGEINVAEIGERIHDLGERMEGISHDVAQAAVDFKDNVVEMSSAAMATMVDLNEASREQLEGLGIHDSEIMDRLIDGRPYRNKMDLLVRMIVPQDVYDMIKDHVDIAGAGDSIKVA